MKELQSLKYLLDQGDYLCKIEDLKIETRISKSEHRCSDNEISLTQEKNVIVLCKTSHYSFSTRFKQFEWNTVIYNTGSDGYSAVNFNMIRFVD